MERIKLRFENVDYTYYRDNTIVVCNAIVRLVNDDFDYIFPDHAGICFRVTGRAKCHPNDTTNIVTGKRLAESRAKLKAYHRAKVFLENEFSRITREYDKMKNGLDFLKNLEIKEKNHVNILAENA